MKLVPLLLSQLRPGEDEGPLLMVLDPPKAQVVGNFSVLLEGVWNPVLSSGESAGSQGGGVLAPGSLRQGHQGHGFALLGVPASALAPSWPLGTL